MTTENHPHQDERPTLTVELTMYRVHGEKDSWRVVAVKRTDLPSEARINFELTRRPRSETEILEHALREVMLR
jgi:hypothetical protein